MEAQFPPQGWERWEDFLADQGVPPDEWNDGAVIARCHHSCAPGHAALLIEERGVLVAGDMLSDVLIPLLDLNDTADPIEDYLAALRARRDAG